MCPANEIVQTTRPLPMLSMQGQGVVKGIAIGKAAVMGAATLEVVHYHIAPHDVQQECDRLAAAMFAASSELESIIQSLPEDSPLELAPLLNVHKLLIEDPELLSEVQALISKYRYNAEWALTVQGQLFIEQFSNMPDEYMRERGADIRQVIERVLTVMSGSGSKVPELLDNTDQEASIVVARDISPADMLRLRDGYFGAFLTDLGGPTSHTAIVARSMNLPAVVGLGSLRGIVRNGDTLIVDGFSGAVFVNPCSVVLGEYQQRQQEILQERKELERLRDVQAVTLDGVQVSMHANIERPEEALAALDAGADGIGLFRTEFLFMGRKHLPSEEEQYQAYASVVKTMAGKPVTIRTLDIGADKTLEQDTAVAINPALGLRAVRYCLAQPELFATQLRAILRASAYGHVRILIPMITSMQEVFAVRYAISQALQQVHIIKPELKPNISLGAMVETPAIAIATEPFAQELDFLSIGTNDLIQYTLAIDRADPDVASLYDPTHPAVLRLVSNVINVGERLGKPVAMCGEMAGDPSLTRLLLGLGLKFFSMHPQRLLDVKKQVMNSHSTALRFRVASSLNHAERINLDSLNS